MIKIDSKVQKLRTTLSTIHQELPDRCIANNQQLFDFKIKLRDLIEELDYKIDIADCVSMLHESFEDLEMYA